MDLSNITLELITETLIMVGIRVVGAIIVLIIGRWIARLLQRAAIRWMHRAQVDETLIKFSSNLIYYLLLAVVFIGVLAIVGIQTASIAAAIAAIGLAIGLALQGSLSNFAAGVLLLILRPYNVGDIIKANDIRGRVDELQIFNSVVITPQNEKVIIPNSQILSGNIVNFSAREYVRIDLIAGIDYGDDIRTAKTVLEDILHTHPLVLEEPAPKVGVLELGDSSVNLAVWPFVRIEDYWAARLDLTEQIKLRLEEAGISIPFPQRDVHLIQPN